MKRALVVTVSLVAAILLARPAPSPAQEDSDSLPAIRIGALEVHPSLSLTETWRDNVFATVDEKEDDFVTSVTPALNLKLPFRGHCLDLDAQANVVSHADHSKLDSTSFQGGAGATFAIGDRVSLKLRDIFRRGYETLMDSPVGDNDRYDTNTASVSAKYAFVDVAQLRLDGSFTTWDFEAGEYRDRNEGQGAVYLYYRVLPKTSAFVEYEFRALQYREDEADDLDSNEHRGLLGVTYEISQLSQGTIKAGYQAKDFRDDAVEDSSTWVASLELTHVLTDTVQLRLAAKRETNETKYLGPRFYTTNGVSADVTVWFLDRLSGNVRAAYGRDEYSDALPGSDEARVDDVITAGAGVTYRFQPWLSINMDYNFMTKDSNLADSSTSENAIALRITAAL